MEEKNIPKKKFENKYIKPFKSIDYVYWPNKGFIVWRKSTGENAELLHIRTFKFRQGYATKLVKEMITRLQENPPYYSVFGFALSSRNELKKIYKNLGFKITEDLPAPYKGEKSFIFYQSFEKLKDIYQ